MTSLVSSAPSTVRGLIRNGALDHCPTSGYSEGYLQTNIAIIEKSYADDFEQFCESNAGPLPLLYRSAPGDLGSGHLADGSNIATDLSGYRVYKEGIVSDQPTNLLDYDLSDFSTFYLGCSFSFEKALRDAGVPVRNVEQDKNVSMFITSVDLQPVGPFKGKLVVSMRPIPHNLLSLCATITARFPKAHGGPVHIGKPAAIGIMDISRPDFGDPVEVVDGDVPVFWCCGVSVMQAVEKGCMQLAFTHGPGKMFITDTALENCCSEKPMDEIFVFPIDPLRQMHGVLSKESERKLFQIEELIAQDPGNRGIGPLRISRDFVSACLALSYARHVLVTTGFPCHTGDSVPYENDGPSGVLSLGFVLASLNKRVTFVVDGPLAGLMKKAIGLLIPRGQINVDLLQVVTYKDAVADKSNDADLLLACERVAPGVDCRYYTMRARALPNDEFIDPIENIFKDSQKLSIGIGDGGNEIGMGKVYDIVCKNVNHGEVIASTVKTDLLITAGVSNWGAWGLGFGLAVLSECSAHERAKLMALGQPHGHTNRTEFAIPSVATELKIEKVVESLGMKDGICKKSMHIDGMMFEKEHTKLLEDLTQILDQ